jgi:hypothetical protein
MTIARLTSMMNKDHHRSVCSAFSDSGLVRWRPIHLASWHACAKTVSKVGGSFGEEDGKVVACHGETIK